MGSALLAVYSVLPVTNAAAVVIAGVVISLCAFLSRVFEHVPDWMTIPPIMMSGYVLPESVIYSGGLTLVAVCLIFCQSLLYLLRRAMLQRDWKPNDKNLPLRFVNIVEYSFSIVAAIALITQAVVPVQENVLYTLFNYVEIEQNTITHTTASACWWLAEAFHWILNYIVEKRSEQLSILRRYRSFRVKVFFAAFGIVVGVVGTFLRPTLPAPKSTVELYFHMTNFCYWASSICFFLAYFVQSWQTAVILNQLQIRSFVFGSIPSTKLFATDGEPVTPVDFPSNVEEGYSHRND